MRAQRNIHSPARGREGVPLMTALKEEMPTYAPVAVRMTEGGKQRARTS